MTPIFLVTGGPAVGKSTTSRELAAQFAKSIHIPVDDVRTMVVSGIVHPGTEWSDALVEQLAAARESVARMAVIYHSAGFAVVIDDFWDPNSHLQEYGALLGHPDVHKVVLYPSQNVAHERNWSRSAPGIVRDWLDDGIRLVYQDLDAAANDLRAHGWLLLDTSQQSAEQAVASIMHQAAIG